MCELAKRMVFTGIIVQPWEPERTTSHSIPRSAATASELGARPSPPRYASYNKPAIAVSHCHSRSEPQASPNSISRRPSDIQRVQKALDGRQACRRRQGCGRGQRRHGERHRGVVRRPDSPFAGRRGPSPAPQGHAGGHPAAHHRGGRRPIERQVQRARVAGRHQPAARAGHLHARAARDASPGRPLRGRAQAPVGVQQRRRGDHHGGQCRGRHQRGDG
jgi:hypothetical protein